MTQIDAPQPVDRPWLPAWTARVDAWMELLSDWVNPILVKETRQALKSQQFVLWFLLLLGGCWVVTIGGLAIIGPKAYYGSFGGQMYQWYAAMLAFPLLVVTPFSAFRSLASEQEDNTRDVLTVSTLSPRQVINGKLGSAVVQMLIYLSALAPCLGFTYLLRGVDALTLALLPTIGVLLSIGLSLIGLLLASVATQRYVQILVSVAFVGALLLLFWGSLELIEEFIDDGYRWYQDEDFWVSMAVSLTLYLTTAWLIYVAAIASNTFTSANRATPLRVAMMVQQAAYIGWVVWLMQQEGEFLALPVFGVAALYWLVAGMGVTSERPIHSERVRRRLPSGVLQRVFLTWLMPGPGLGYFFIAANLSFCLAMALAWAWWFPGPTFLAPTRQVQICLIIALYMLTYLGVGRLVIAGVRRLTDLSLVGGVLIHFLLMLAGSALPFLLRASFLMFRRQGFSYIDLPSLPSMISQFERGLMRPSEVLTFAIFIGAAFLSVLIANIALAVREVRQTRVPLPRRVLEDDHELTPQRVVESSPWGDVSASP